MVREQIGYGIIPGKRADMAVQVQVVRDTDVPTELLQKIFVLRLAKDFGDCYTRYDRKTLYNVRGDP
jgi:hypothetical protein